MSAIRWFSVVMVLGACAPKEPPCSRELAALSNAHSDRQHGFTQSDDVREAIRRLQDALACVDGARLAQLIPHARQIHARLAVRGNVDELTSLAKILGSAAHRELQEESTRIADEVRRTRTAADALNAHAAKALTEAKTPEAIARAKLMTPDPAAEKAERPVDTSLFITHVSTWESCVAVLPGAGLPKGTALASIMRGTVAFPLHGDPPAFQVSERTARLLRFCTSSTVVKGDVFKLVLNGATVFETVLAPTLEDEARGASLVALGTTGKVPDACSAPETLDGRLGCEWGRRSAP